MSTRGCPVSPVTPAPVSSVVPPSAGRQRAGDEADGQSAVIAFLARPESYATASPPPGPWRGDEAGGAAGMIETPGMIETHGAIVFLVGDKAYKIKKSVKYAFLDYSTLEARHAACLEELRVNRAWAPALYLGVAPVARAADGGLVLGGDGPAVEWVVCMQRFSQDDLYSARAERGELSPDDVARLAPVIRAGHARADRVLTKDAPARAMARLLAESADSFAQEPALFPPGEAGRLIADAREALERLRPLLAQRASGGFVRRCHGDLHLGNIVCWDGAPTPFDAIEFDPAIATVDVLDDLSFLLMDLWSRGLERCANLLFNLYLAGDPGLAALAGVEALPLFLAGRAMIRARAAALRASHGARPAGESGDGAAARAEAQAYFALARRFLVPRQARLVAVGGLPGSGKTTLARALCVRLGGPPGAVHLQSDVERKAMIGLPPSARAPGWAYAPEVAEAVYRLLRKKAATVLKANAAVLVDAAHLRPEQRAALEAVAREQGAAFTGLWLDAPRETLLERVAEREQRQSSGGESGYSDAGVDVLRKQLAGDAGSDGGSTGWIVVPAGGSLGELAVDCEKLL